MEYKRGCLIEAAKNKEIDAIAHCCNCFNTMKSGIAFQIAKAFPEAEDVDNDTKKGSWGKFGQTSHTYSYPGILIFNLYGQYKYYPRHIRHLHYDALERSLTQMAGWCKRYGVKTIGLPKVGSDLAGGDWEVIKPIISKTLKDFNVTIYIKE